MKNKNLDLRDSVSEKAEHKMKPSGFASNYKAAFSRPVSMLFALTLAVVVAIPFQKWHDRRWPPLVHVTQRLGITVIQDFYTTNQNVIEYWKTNFHSESESELWSHTTIKTNWLTNVHN